MHLEGGALMAAGGQSVSHEFQTSWSPEEVVRYVILQAAPLNALGYRVEHHTTGGVVLVRRFTPTSAWAAPLCIAGIVFGLGVLGPNATVESAAVAGRIALLAVIAAVVLGLVVKTNERITFSANPEGEGSRVIVSGTATPGLRDFVLALGTPPENHRAESPVQRCSDAPEGA